MTHKYDEFCQTAIINVEMIILLYRICGSTVVGEYAHRNDTHIIHLTWNGNVRLPVI